MFEKARDRGVDGTERKRWMERNGTDGATARFVTFGFGREKRANDVDDDGDDGDDDDARRASFHSSVHRLIDSFIHSFALGVFLALARASGGFARDDDDDDDDDDGWWWFAASFGGVG